jgi:anti-sigma regulatory factor (Ser/Thr protein kinase)
MSVEMQKQDSIAKTEIELHICANPEYLGVVRTAVRQVTGVLGMTENEIESVTLAVVEALTNVIRHSYGGPCEESIIVKFSKIECCDKNKAALEITIRDFGKQVEPEKIKGRDLSKVRPGGLGVHIIQSVVDEIEFSRADECGMLLRMVKYLT